MWAVHLIKIDVIFTKINMFQRVEHWLECPLGVDVRELSGLRRFLFASQPTIYPGRNHANPERRSLRISRFRDEIAVIPKLPPIVTDRSSDQVTSGRSRRLAWREVKKRLPIVVAIIVVAGVLTAGVGIAMRRAWRSQEALRLAEQGGHLLDQEDWEGAGICARAARSLRPEYPEVQRAMADFVMRAGGDAHGAISILQKLVSGPGASLDDRARLMAAHLKNGSPEVARAIYEQMPAADQKQPPVREQLADILRVEGRAEEAARVLRAALEDDDGNPESRVKLAVLKIKSEAFSEREKASVDDIWRIASDRGRAGIRAIEVLATQIELNGNDPKRLMQLADAHPSLPPRVRYQVLAAFVRAHPLEKDAVVRSQLASNAGKPVSQWPPFLRWLAALGRDTEIVRILPERLALSSRELFSIWAEALLATGGAQRLQGVLTRGDMVPVDAVSRLVLLAECAAKTGARPEEVIKRIETVYQAGEGRRAHSAGIFRVTQLAEASAHWDTAAIGYAQLAKLNPSATIEMLEKVYEMNMRQRKGDAMLAVARDMHNQQPENVRYQKRITYLNLLLGIGIEKEWIAALGSTLAASAHTIVSAEMASGTDPLMRLLACYRLGDHERAASLARELTDPRNLEPGQRAVAAGILAWCGDQASAGVFLEQVPGLLLLPEERIFLRWLKQEKGS